MPDPFPVTVKHSKTKQTTQIRERDIPAYERRGWVPVDDEGQEQTPTSNALVGEWRDFALAKDPDNHEAIAAMTKAELQERYG